jgi:hypothetical protein
MVQHRQHSRKDNRVSTVVDLCAWAIATGRLTLVARCWLFLESEVDGGA